MAESIMDDGANSVLSELKTVEDLQNMKVADLKKELKLHGLSTVGNKSDLINRLSQHSSFKTGETSIENEGLATTDDQGDGSLENEETNSVSSDEDEIDVSDDRLHFIDDTKNNIAEKDETESPFKTVIRGSVESTSSTEIQKQSLNSEQKTIETASDKISGVQEKKLLLKRTNPSTFPAPIISHTPVEPVQNKSEESSKPRKIITPLKVLTSPERLQMRAKRFNLSVKSTNGTESLTKNRGVKRNNDLSTATAAPDVDLLKKRAARFGQSVSTVMKQIEEKEKVLKRKLRFGCSATASLGGLSKVDEEEKKRRRAERFGIL